MSTRAGIEKLRAGVGKYKLGTRVGKYKLRPVAGEYKLRAGNRETQIPLFKHNKAEIAKK